MEMKLSELQEEMKKLLGPMIEEAVTPLRQQQTDWFATMVEEARKTKASGDGAEKGIRAARFVRCLAASKGNLEQAEKRAKKWWGNEDEVTKALAAGDAQSGGVFVPPTFSTELIELLRNAAAVRSLGPRVMPMPNGTLTIPKQTGGTTVGYIGENTNISPTEITTGMLTLTWKKLAALVPISNDLLQFDAISADAVVRDDLVASMALREDLAFLRGDGLQNTPKGLLNWIV